jgi:hypothetical protein
MSISTAIDTAFSMHVEDLRWFAVLAETEHLTEAAAALGHQSAEPLPSLQRVERAFGVRCSSASVAACG